MLTLDDFLKEYDNYTDEQLQNLYLNREDYSEEANQAMRTVIENRGGLDRITERLMQKQSLLDETARIRNRR